jgi:tetrahydromethanopterin S-methyltransferase subunit F
MKIDENIDPKAVNDSAEARKKEALIRENEIRLRQEGVKKAVVTTSIIGFVVLLIAVFIAFSLYNRDHKQLISQMEIQKNVFTEKLTSRDSSIGEWVTTFGDIEKNIAIIKEKEHIISTNSSNVELSKDKRQQVVEDIKYINTLLEQNKRKIASLNAQLNKSGGTIKALQSTITQLEASVKQSESDIADLKAMLLSKKFEIEQLNAEKTDLQGTIVQKDEKINTQTYEMNKAFFACGTFKQLKAKGLLTKEGGFIGLGKTKTLAASFPDSSFKQIDITVMKSIPVNSKNAKLISEHPANSYKFIRDKDKKIESIEITDPVQFWKISKYAVVEISK